MPAARSLSFSHCAGPRHQRQRHTQMAAPAQARDINVVGDDAAGQHRASSSGSHAQVWDEPNTRCGTCAHRDGLAGATVRLPAGFDPAELRSIVQILAALR